MGGQVLGGGVIVLVAVLLWLVYLLPSWYNRRQYDAAERNAVRLNQALRVLAETSETPQEVRLELNARTALAQQKLARRALAEREQAALEQAKVDLEDARAARAAARSALPVRRARARRRTRLVATLAVIAGLGVAGYGVWEVVSTGSQLLMWGGIALAAVGGLCLRRMSAVAAREAGRRIEAPVATRSAAEWQEPLIESDPRTWTPRELPKPLTASAGSQAVAMLDAEDARAAARRAGVDDEMRRRAEEARPPSIAVARTARSAEMPRSAAVDDDAIEAHVRDLLARRAVGA